MITIKHLSQKAKVSPSTVSRALNKPLMVKTETRDKILKLAQKHNYVPNFLARGLSTQKSKILGVLIPTITLPIFALSTKGIQDYFEDHGYQIIIGNTDYDEKKERRLISVFKERRVDGIIFMGMPKDSESIINFKKSKFPFVVTWDTVEDPEINVIAFDNFKSAYEAIEYLIRLGHKKIATIQGVFSASNRACMRWKAYKKCLEDNGINYDPNLAIQKFQSYSNGWEAMNGLLKRRPTAVFCGTDITALGAIRAIYDAGLKVPHDISVIGFDDSEQANFSFIRLTTIQVPAYEMGRSSAILLNGLINKEVTRPQSLILETKLIIRDSCCEANAPMNLSGHR